jgi:hypothetical protein
MDAQLMRAPTFAMTMFILSIASPGSALCQNCAISENLKIKKSVPGTYTEEATKKNAEG